VVVRHGRLAATATTGPGADPRPTIAALKATAEHVPPPIPPACAAHPEETEIVLDWLDQPGVRLVDVDDGWGCPVHGAEAYRAPGATTSAVAAAAALKASPDPGPES
jgi:DNA polymerase III subunit epsilon